MRIIFSRDRPAQLDLLLRSIDRHMGPDDTRIIWYASSGLYRHGYERITRQPPQSNFSTDLRRLLAEGPETVTFFCDDDIVFRPVLLPPGDVLAVNKKILCHSLSLGRGNAKQPVPKGFPLWSWAKLPRHDFGFPCGLNGNTYRPADFLALMGDDDYADPTWLETMASMRLDQFKRSRPLMASFVEQSVVSVAVNRTSVSQGAPAGRTFPQSAAKLASRYLRGQRIDLDAIDFTGVDSVHHEIEFAWK